MPLTFTAAATWAPENLPAAHAVRTLIPSLSAITRIADTPEFSAASHHVIFLAIAFNNAS
ncbi:MAG TPA: hypothetical protein VE959_00375 [Bryobacteraceae bacterium]|nr:hypothetical protein [Bryobacteraceae bacterium]